MTVKKMSVSASQRQLRVGETIRHTLAEIFRRNDFRDPTLQDVSLTVTEVRISPDLKNATAFISALGSDTDKMQKIIAALNKAAGYVRSAIAPEITLRHVPSITFMADISLEYANHIDQLLKQHVSKDG